VVKTDKIFEAAGLLQAAVAAPVAVEPLSRMRSPCASCVLSVPLPPDLLHPLQGKKEQASAHQSRPSTREIKIQKHHCHHRLHLLHHDRRHLRLRLHPKEPVFSFPFLIFFISNLV